MLNQPNFFLLDPIKIHVVAEILNSGNVKRLHHGIYEGAHGLKNESNERRNACS